MEFTQTEQIISLLKKYWLPVLLALLGLIFFIYGMIVLLGTSNQPQEDKFDTSAQPEAPIPIKLIAIDIEGQVVNPGVYKLKQGSLIQDALVSSGGLSSDADRDWVAKNLNLAAKLTDGQKIYVPSRGEGLSTSVLGSQSQASGLINVNSANETELDALPSIGPVTAQKIISQRPYATINELLDKKVVSQKIFDKIKDKIIAQ